MADNTLYYGDNLDVLRRHVKDETVDLVYLDPPFNSNANYNVLFAEHNGSRSGAQIRAFEDTWRWDQVASAAYDEITTSTMFPQKVSQVMQSFRNFLGDSDMTAYLCMMAPRMVELRRVVKPMGSIYLHCDPGASHYLKLLMDAVFGPENFRNEIVWRRSHPKGQAFTRLASTHDVILAFAKNAGAVYWSPIYLPHDTEKAEQQYSLMDDNGRRYQLTSLLNPNPDRPNLTYEFKGVTKVWRWTKERMMEADAKGLIVVPKEGRGIPRFKRYLDEQEGIPLGDWWGDIEIVAGGERLGYPTQKPEALLERIILASSKVGDVVLDPFCGCGTAVVAAERLKRHWIGIDITHLAITLIKHRLQDAFGEALQYKVVGEPVSLPDAETLAAEDPYQFQWWALGLVGARPAEQKKGADKGIDGRLFFHDEAIGGKTKQIVFSVKAGHIRPEQVQALRGVIEKEKAAIGVFISLQEPSRQMRAEAASAGFYESPGWNKKYPRLQLLTIAELLQGKRIEYPPSRAVNVTFKKAAKAKGKGADTGEIPIIEQDASGPAAAADAEAEKPVG